MTQTQAQTIHLIYPARHWQVDASQHRTLSSYPILQPVMIFQMNEMSAKLIIFNVMKSSMKLPLRLVLKWVYPFETQHSLHALSLT